MNLMRRRNAFLSSECKVSRGDKAGEWNEGLASTGRRFRWTDFLPGTCDTQLDSWMIERISTGPAEFGRVRNDVVSVEVDDGEV